MAEPACELPSDSMTEQDRNRNRVLTLPNIICMFRLLGAFALVGLALAGNLRIFTITFVILNLSDWIDGRLARWLKQRSDFGARLDSFADAVLYATLFFGLFWMRWDVLGPEAPWWISAWFSYVLTTAAGVWKFQRVPSYHTYGAKFSQWLLLIGVLALLLGWSVWPFRFAMLAVTLTNLEAMLITLAIKKWQADILSLAHIWGQAKSPSIEQEPADEKKAT